jgi:hypothetical protein
MRIMVLLLLQARADLVTNQARRSRYSHATHHHEIDVGSRLRAQGSGLRAQGSGKILKYVVEGFA